jgi:hypothetical protein
VMSALAIGSCRPGDGGAGGAWMRGHGRARGGRGLLLPTAIFARWTTRPALAPPRTGGGTGRRDKQTHGRVRIPGPEVSILSTTLTDARFEGSISSILACVVSHLGRKGSVHPLGRKPSPGPWLAAPGTG